MSANWLLTIEASAEVTPGISADAQGLDACRAAGASADDTPKIFEAEDPS